MATKLEIKCMKKSNRTDPHERIHGVGGLNADGTRWYLTIEAAIAGIDAMQYQFWTKGGGKIVNVKVANHNGHKYLKTEADGIHPNNLLSLPECP